MAKGRDHFGITVKSRMFYEQIGKKVEATGLEIGSGVNGRS